MWPTTREQAIRDLVASFALAAIVIPEQLATARLAGVPPALGLIVFIAASFGFFLFGANRYLSAGADSTIAPIFAGALALMAAAGSPHYLALAAALALMVGALAALAGLLRLGWIARLLSVPIITGFLAGIAIHIAVSQLPALLGIPGGGANFFGAIVSLGHNIGRFNPHALAIGLFVFAAAALSERIDRRFPGALVAMALATLAVTLSGWAVPVLGEIHPPAFMPALPQVTLTDLTGLLPIAMIVTLVVMIQTAAVSRAFDGGEHEIDRDLLGVGIGGMLSGLLGGFAANASPPRTAIVRESGGSSRLAGLFAVVIVGLFLIFAPGLLAHLPEAALAGLLLFVALRIFHIGTMRTIAMQSWAEFLLLMATALAIVVMPIAIGVGVGVALSLLHGVWIIVQTRAVIFELIPGTTVWWPKNSDFQGETKPGLVVAGFQAPLFFLNADTFRVSLDHAVKQATPPVKAIVLEASSLVELDYSGAQTLSGLIRQWKERGVVFYVARLESLRAQQAFVRFGILPLLAHGKTYPSVADAVRQFDRDFPPAR
ncbi:MAG TPA: SulP family inorganic anion transporter [Rhizomicrobium sp.]|nr:SulP family inorganic anion transporter [Rhizomicrobium sp.]